MEYELFKASLILKFRYVKGQCSHIEKVEKETERNKRKKKREKERKSEKRKIEKESEREKR